MSIRVSCPSCTRRLRVPEHLAGRRVTCPRCSGPMVVPLAETAPAEATSSAETAAEPEVPDIADWPWPGRFGVISVGLGLISVLILPVCLLGYLAFILSGAGLMLGLAGLVGALRNGESASVPLPAGGAGVARRFGTRAVDFPLAGVVACALALVLALLPFLFS